MKRLLRSLLMGALTVASAMGLFADAIIATPQPASLAAEGGELTLNIEVTYDSTPAAMGLELALPEGWSLVGVQGNNRPAIAPNRGATGRLECAWMRSPAHGMKVQLILIYPADPTGSLLSGKVILRRDGQPVYLKVRVPLQREVLTD
jgi:hypothetical protein